MCHRRMYDPDNFSFRGKRTFTGTRTRQASNMPICETFKSDGRRCQSNTVHREGIPDHLHFCSMHNRVYEQRVARANGEHHQPGRCQKFENGFWCAGLIREGSVFCEHHHTRNEVAVHRTLERQRIEERVRDTVAILMAEQPPPAWREVVLTFVNQDDPDDILYRVGLQYFIARFGGHVEEFRQYWIWAERGMIDPEPVFVPPPLVPPHAPERELERIVRDAQNVHTTHVSHQTNSAVTRLLEVRVPELQQTEVSMIRNWVNLPTPPRISHLLRTVNDINRWFHQNTCRQNNDRLYNRVLRGLVALINQQPEESRRELYQRLWEECYESVNMCCEGHISRLCNVMVGFDDAFQPPISVGEVLQAKMAMIAGLDVPVEMKRTHAEAVMNELGIPDNQRAAWLDAF